MNDEFAGLIQTPETQTSALYLTETLVDISERPNFLARLSGDEYRQVRAVGREMKFGPQSEIFSQGEQHDGIFVIESGDVRTYYLGPSGRELTLAYWTRGILLVDRRFGGVDTCGRRRR